MSVVNLHAADDSAAANLSDRIYDLIIERLQRGEVGPGERLIDAALANQFQVSRMPARDALMRLSHQGYLERTTRGFVLPRLTRQDILDVFELRRLIEPQAVAMAAQSMTDEALARLARELEGARAAMQRADTAGVFRNCETLRNGWIATVPNAAIRNAMQRYMTHIQVVRMLTFGVSANQAVVVSAYGDLVDAFRKRDSVGAASRLLRFIFEGEAAYLAVDAGQQRAGAPAPCARA